MDDTATYVCPSCGEEIVTPVDASEGKHQEYVEDCPICCRPNILRIELRNDGKIACEVFPE